MLLLAALVVVALAVRTYRLSEQSIWIDDRWVGNLSAHSLAQFLAIFRLHGREMVPLYWTTLYAWGRMPWGDSMVAVRMLSVALSVACLPILYLFGRRLHSVQAGLIAAALAALSPMLAYLGQGIRTDAMFHLLAVLSAYSLYCALQEKTRWWWGLHLLANLMLLLTHLFGVFLMAAEGCVLLWLWRAQWRKLLAWTASCAALLLLPLLYAFRALTTTPTREDDFYMQIPPLLSLLADWLADDAVILVDPFAFQGQTWSFFSESFAPHFVSLHTRFDVALILFFAACVLWALWQLRPAGASASLAPGAKTGYLLALAMGLLPLVLMVVVSLVWRPVVLPRYTGYSAFGLYLLAGCAVASIGEREIRAVVLCALAAVYGYQLSLMLPASTRTDFLSAARLIRANASANDIVYLKGTFVSWETFRFNYRELPCPVVPLYTLEGICEESRTQCSKRGGERVVWAVIEPFIYTYPPLERFEAALQERGLQFEKTFLPGCNGLYVYRIAQGGKTESDAPVTVIDETRDYGPYLADFEAVGMAPEQRAHAEHALRLAIDSEWPRTAYYYPFLSLNILHLSFVTGVKGDIAELAGKCATHIAPDYAFGYYALAWVYGEQGRVEAAREAFDKAVELDAVGFFQYQAGLFDALYLDKNPGRARDEFARLDKTGMYLPAVARERAFQLPYFADRLSQLIPGLLPPGV